MIRNVKIILVNKASGNNYSLEAGLNDNKKNYDHHGKDRRAGSPCNKYIELVENGAVIEITHMDADTFIGLLRMLGRKLPTLNFYVMEQIDSNGGMALDRLKKILDPSIDVYRHPVKAYMIGIKILAGQMHFPRWRGENIDVTSIVLKMMEYNEQKIIEKGLKIINRNKEAYQRCHETSLKTNSGEMIGLWVCKKKEDSFSQSDAFRNGYSMIIVSREHYGSISIYCHPDSNYEFEGKTIAGIDFVGHPKACGSPRNSKFGKEKAGEVFSEIFRVISP